MLTGFVVICDASSLATIARSAVIPEFLRHAGYGTAGSVVVSYSFTNGLAFVDSTSGAAGESISITAGLGFSNTPGFIALYRRTGAIMFVTSGERPGVGVFARPLDDPHGKRFRAGSVEIGFGVVSELHAAPDGALWALLPWSARAVRITPR